jgi:hypothetical protein
MELSHDTLELLRDEAYVLLCRDTCEQHVDLMAKEAVGLVHSRPPFGLLARKQTRDAFANSVRTVADTEAALRDRLARITRLKNWLQRWLRVDLIAYLTSASPEFERIVRLQQMLNQWETGVQQMPDMLVGFARDMRALRQAAVAAIETPSFMTAPCLHEFAMLRDIAVRLEEEQRHLDQLATAINAETVQLAGNEVRLPTVPAFRRTVWVDWLSMIPLDQVVAELTRVEFEVRSFVNGGFQPISAKLQATRSWCTLTQDSLLEQYWVQLRAHALAHYVEERDVDEVMESLAQRYEPQMSRGQRELMHDPFLAER